MDALVRLYPEDHALALRRALSRPPAERVDSLRALTRRWPDYAPPQLWLAVNLVISPIRTYDAGVADEVLAAADAGVRGLPNDAGALGVRGFVAERRLRHDEPMTFLDRSSRVAPIFWVYENKAEIAVRERKTALARAYLDSAIAAAPSPARRVLERGGQALRRVYEGSIQDAIAGLKGIALQAEADSLPGAAAYTHAYLSALYAATNDTAAVRRELAEATRLELPRVDRAGFALYAAALTDDGAQAAEQLAVFQEAARDPDAGLSAEDVHSVTGLAALANGKYDEAIAHFKQGGADPQNQLGTIEALTRLGRKKEAAAARDSLMARRNAAFDWLDVPIAIYRSTMKRK